MYNLSCLITIPFLLHPSVDQVDHISLVYSHLPIKYFDSNFLSERKKISSPCFIVSFAKVMRHKIICKKLLACQILLRKGNGTTSSVTRMLFWLWNKINPQRVFKQKWSWVRDLFMWYIFYCVIDIISHILLYIVVNSKWMIKNDWKKEKLT